MSELTYSNLSDADLLGKLIGTKQSRKLYRGSLVPLFTHRVEPERTQEKFLAARELVKRWLAEELKERCVLSTPEAVRDYLRIHFAGHERESFVAVHLDAQNRLISAETLFHGTLTQTSVYPREVVKGLYPRTLQP
jgi:DNA repair protein RadC